MGTAAPPFAIEADLPYLPADLRAQYGEPFAYTIQLGTVTHAASASGQIVVDSASNFIVVAQTAAISSLPVTDANTVAPDEVPIRIYLQAASSAVAYCNAAGGVMLGHWFGTAQHPFYWTRRGLPWKAGDNINVVANNLDPAIDYNLSLTFVGFKTFPNFPDQVTPEVRS
jgi:hypothetical protein